MPALPTTALLLARNPWLERKDPIKPTNSVLLNFICAALGSLKPGAGECRQLRDGGVTRVIGAGWKPIGHALPCGRALVVRAARNRGSDIANQGGVPMHCRFVERGRKQVRAML